MKVIKNSEDIDYDYDLRKLNGKDMSWSYSLIKIEWQKCTKAKVDKKSDGKDINK